MDDADGIGMIATGAIVAREIDRAHAPGYSHEANCLNCGTALAGEFCSRCGQAGHVHRTAMALFHDIAHGVFHFEGRIWHTLPLLARKPGELTRRYVHGERAKFVSPMALFLFSVFLLFAAVNRLASPDVSTAAQGLARAQSELSDQTDRAQERLQELVEKRGEALSEDDKADVRALDQNIADARQALAGLGIAAAHIPKGKPAAGRPAGHEAGPAKGLTGIDAIDRQIAHITDNPALFAYKLKMASYKFSWALIPISVPFIWLLFCFRRDVGFYDHAIFAIYSLSFMTLLVVGLIGLHLIGIADWVLWTIFLITPPIHMYKQLKGAYRLGRWGAWWRMWTLLMMTGVSATLFFLLLLWLEAE